MIKELKSWGIIVVLFLTLYLSGLHTEVAAFAQRIILSTGLIAPDTELSIEEKEDVDYNFKLQDLEGNVVSLSEFKNKVIFLNVWASWCPPCIAEMPSIQSLYDKIDNDDIIFIMLSMDKKSAKAKKFIDRKKYTFPVYTAASKVPDVFRAPSIPTTYVISKEGKIVSKKVGMANYDKKSFLKFLNKQTASTD
ncbi:TlpA family protein disulfide reductase [Fulvivirga sp. M361]|nr:TlpA family protein disulfide reductase [Fulvivirga sp. M361]